MWNAGEFTKLNAAKSIIAKNTIYEFRDELALTGFQKKPASKKQILILLIILAVSIEDQKLTVVQDCGGD